MKSTFLSRWTSLALISLGSIYNVVFAFSRRLSRNCVYQHGTHEQRASEQAVLACRLSKLAQLYLFVSFNYHKADIDTVIFNCQLGSASFVVVIYYWTAGEMAILVI